MWTKENWINYCYSCEKMCQVSPKECQEEDAEVAQSLGSTSTRIHNAHIYAKAEG